MSNGVLVTLQVCSFAGSPFLGMLGNAQCVQLRLSDAAQIEMLCAVVGFGVVLDQSRPLWIFLVGLICGG